MRAKTLGKSIVLIILIVVLVLFGLMWFDYLGIIQMKKFFSPVYKLFGLVPQTTTADSSPNDLSEADLDNDRWAKRLEALDIRTEELDKRESDVQMGEENNAQIAQELEDQKKAQEEREKTFNSQVRMYDDRKVNIEQIVQNLNGMQPVKAVAILEEMDDQDIIDVLRQAEVDASSSGTSSMGSYWLSLMKPDRAAEIQRKMANKPTSIMDDDEE
ncbi:MAG: flagellar protein FlbB [Treponema sp.]|nr:flagellar protein FlbB [Treponema sp.]MBQ2552899.1 flagellar protein FlbB [Treponema sp.]MBQ4235639.1 flagellar protein FlbB [Treponema sp.]MBQ5383757.1 flagellar protein FlbB [Treponema sp.]